MPIPFTGPRPFPVALAVAGTGVNGALYPYIRALLTGDPFGVLPAVKMMDFYIADTLLELFRSYRCLSENGAGLVINSAMNDGDRRFLYRAASIEIALQVLSGVGGDVFQESVIKTTTNNVEETVQAGRTLSDALAFLRTEKARMLARITCIAKARASQQSISLMGLTGYTRAQEARRCYGGYGGYISGPFGYNSGWFWGGFGAGF